MRCRAGKGRALSSGLVIDRITVYSKHLGKERSATKEAFGCGHGGPECEQRLEGLLDGLGHSTGTEFTRTEQNAHRHTSPERLAPLRVTGS